MSAPGQGARDGGAGRPLRVYVSAGEASGDALGAGLITALKRATGDNVIFAGAGGPRMARAGLETLYPMSDVSVMGLFPVLGKLPVLIRRWRQSLKTVLAFNPDVMIIIDFQEYHHLLARAVRKRRPGLPIIDYVPPTVWAWRPKRAPAMKGYITESLAVFPFEPEAHERLGAPPCVYVGHPLTERLEDFRAPEKRAGKDPLLLVLPGSRSGEIQRMLDTFGKAVALIRARRPDCRIVIPAHPPVRDLIEAGIRDWAVKPEIISGDEAKLAAYRGATAALAKSGTVTLELALARVPMVVGYILDWVSARFQWLVKVPSIVLPNLIVGHNAIPEFIHDACTPEALAEAVLPLLEDGPVRQAQLSAFDELEERMTVPDATPSERAAQQVLRVVSERRLDQPRSSTGT